MSIQLILSTDKLQSGFRAKYNTSVNEIWVSLTDNNNGTVTIEKFSGGTIIASLTGSFFTKSEVTSLIAGLVPSRQPIEYAFNQDDILEDGAGSGNWYIEYKTETGEQVPDGVMPYAVMSQIEDPDNPGEFIQNPISPFVYNKTIWTFPRIYSFPDPSTPQDIIIYSI